MPYTRPGRADRSRGQGMVETALVLLTLLAMILFIMDMGRVLFLGQYVTERARATARAAVVNNWNTTTVRNYFCWNTLTRPQGATDTSPGMLGITPSQISYSLLGTAGTPNYRVQVQVTNIRAVMFVPFMSSYYRFPSVSVEMPAQSMGATN